MLHCDRRVSDTNPEHNHCNPLCGDNMFELIWLVVFIGAGLALAYHRLSLRTATIAMGALLVVYTLSGPGWLWGLFAWVIYAGLATVLNTDAIRQSLITQPIMDFFRKVLPTMSATERTALDAGTVWWEGELFTGQPDWERLRNIPAPQLSEEEQAFLDGPVRDVMGMCDEWQITHEDGDLPPEVWERLKKDKFFGMIIPKDYGGLGFSAYAHSSVLAQLNGGPAGTVLSSTVAVPNSLGPAELLLHYGTDEQRDYYLPRLADGREIPCFGLTSPHAGSDAGAIPDNGIVCYGEWNGEQVLGMRLTWDKRYITLAPIASVLGLAFKLYDPEGHLGDEANLGTTCALIPTDTEGVITGRRHYPINTPFQNGPTQGTDVFVPLDFIIGGQQMIGEGWRMVVECLSVGRAISLPSSTTGGANSAALATGAYARIRRQFDIHIGAFEGVQEALARIGGRAYACESVRRFTANAVDLGEKPAVSSAIAKYHCTTMAQQVSIDAMDVHAGKGVCIGPSNYLARGYEGAPVSITVEGANILTRGMMIFGQGAIRCHPFVLSEMEAVADEKPGRGLTNFDQAFFAHIGHDLSAAARSLVMGVTRGYGSKAPHDPNLRRHYQRLNRYAANLALLTDIAMGTLGGSLKFRESLSARLGDILSHMYIVSATLKRFQEDGAHTEDLPLVDWVCADRFAAIEETADGVLNNLPSRPAAWLARILIFPLGRHARRPSDKTDTQIANLLLSPNATRDRIGATTLVGEADENPLGLLDETMTRVIDCHELEKRILKAHKTGQITSDHPAERIEQASTAGIIDDNEAAQLRELHDYLMAVIQVDDFDSSELQAAVQRQAGSRQTQRKSEVA